MSVFNVALKIVGAGLFLGAASFVHFRGRVRHRFSRQLTDHSTFMAPLNALLYWSSAVPAKTYHDPDSFPALKPLEDSWPTIRDEALKLLDDGYIRAAAKYNDLGFQSFFRTGWKRFYLKWYDAFLPSARLLCPQTVALLQSIPSIHGAMFAVLPPGGRLVRHRDPFAGSLRYHLGLDTPNSPDCYLMVDGEPYFWRDGEAVIFDETYIHYAENKTQKSRMILFCDVERPLRSRVTTALNRFLINHVFKATATQNIEHEKVGVLNKVFSVVIHIRLLGKRIKAFNKGLYYAIKYALMGAILYWVFV
jgi:beta-hydroxylase